MSDLSRGPGWWLAVDGKWYPPEAHPEYVSPRQPPPGSPPGTARDRFGGARALSTAFFVVAYAVLAVGGFVTWRLVESVKESSATTQWWVGALSGGVTLLVAAGLSFFGLVLQLLRAIAVSIRR